MPAQPLEVSWAELAKALSAEPSFFSCIGPVFVADFRGSSAAFLKLPCRVDVAALAALGALQHEVLAPMLAFAVGEAETCVVYAWRVEMLRDRLTGSGAALGWGERLAVGAELVRLLLFLEEYVQSEVDSTCVGVTAEGNPVVFGIGLNELIADRLDRLRGLPGYRCPVLAQGFVPFDAHAQEFNVGVLLLELLTASSPVETHGLPLYLYVRKVFTEDFGRTLVAVNALIDGALAADVAQQLAERLLDIALNCTGDYPEERPSLSDVYRYLEDMRETQRDITASLETGEVPQVSCSTCGEDYYAGVFCEQGHYLCTDCLNGLVLSWSGRKHLTTKSKGCIFCPKRFEFEGYYLENRRALCEAEPWRIEDLRGVISDEVYATYMERVFKTDPSSDKILRTSSSTRDTLPTATSDGERTRPESEIREGISSKDIACLVTPVDDYGTIMTTMTMDNSAEDAGSRAHDAEFYKKFEMEKRKLANDAKLQDSMKPLDQSRRDRSNSKLSMKDKLSSKHSLRSSGPAVSSAALSSRLSLQRQVLLKLFNSTNGPQWRRRNNWGKTKSFWGRAVPVGEWYHVVTNETGDVFELELNNNRLTGTILPEIGSLTFLTVLNLSFNSLKGVIPPQLCKLENLKGLYLNDNQLVGELPSELGDMQRLVWVDVSNNKLTGHIPKSVGALADLRVLALNNNLLTGNVPPELSELRKLELLALHCNRFTGAMTEILKTNPRLKMSY